MATRGIAARALIPPFPSKTFPSHCTIATGLYPGHHGILSNTFYDPSFGKWFRVKDTATVRDGTWYGGTPIWVAAECEGVRATVYFWPGSESAVQGVRQTAWWNYRASIPDSVRVDASLAHLRRSGTVRPHLVMLYLSGVDDTTHRHGPDTPHTANAVAGHLRRRRSADRRRGSDPGVRERAHPSIPRLAAAAHARPAHRRRSGGARAVSPRRALTPGCASVASTRDATPPDHPPHAH